ncbi:MAG: hypothetical protein RLZZ248_76 [Bacteroidota bacterium]
MNRAAQALSYKIYFMKRLLIFLFCHLTVVALHAQKSLTDAWNDLEKLEQLGRPQSAIQLLDSIVEISAAANNFPYLIKSHFYRLALYNQYLQNPQQEYLKYLNEKYDEAPFPVKEIIALPLAKCLLNIELDRGSGTSAAVDRALQLINGSLSNPQLFEMATRDYAPIFQKDNFNPEDYQTYWQIDTSYSRDGSGRQPTLMDVLIKEADKIFQHPLLSDYTLEKRFVQTAASFHQLNQDTTAWLFNLLEYSHYELSELLQLYEKFPGPEILLKLGTYYWNHNDSPKATPIFERLVQEYRHTYEAAMAKKNLEQINKPFFNVQIPEVITSSKDIRLTFTSKNIQQLYYSILPMEVSNWMSFKRKPPNEILQQLPNRKPQLSLLPKDTLLPNPGNGQYVLLVSDSPSPLSTEQTEELKILFFQVSDLSFFQTTKGAQKQLIVTNALNGQPIEGISFEFFENQNYSIDGFMKKRPNSVLISNKDGAITIPSSLPARTVFRMINGADTLYHDDLLINNPQPITLSDTLAKTYIVTDKAIYTPGNQVAFKIIHYRSIKAKPAQVLPSVSLTISLLNTKGEVQSLQKVTTNEFGTASGTFIIPEGERSGNWSLKVEENASSRVFFVEEYTLPEVELTMTILNKSPKAGDTLLLSGQLTAYSGRNPSGAKIKISLLPQDIWYKRNLPPSGNGGQPFWNNVVYTDVNGRFLVEVPTKTDPGRFQIRGEAVTLSGSSCDDLYPIVLGIQKWKPTINIPDQVVAYQPFEAQLNLLNVLNIPGEAPFHFSIRSEKEGRILFQEFGLLKESQTFPVIISENCSGPLIAELLIYEEDGTFESVDQSLILIDSDFKYRDEEKGFLYYLESNHLQEGDALNLKLASDIPVYLIWESASGASETVWIEHNQASFTKIMNEGKGILHLIGVKDHRLFYHQEPIEVSQTEKNLIVKYDQFATTLIPGQKVRWDFSLTNPEGKAALSEVAAVLYNKALDERAVQQWQFPPILYRNYPSLYVSSGLFQNAQVVSWQNRKDKPIFYPPLVLPIIQDYAIPVYGVTPLMMRTNSNQRMEEKIATIPEESPIEDSSGEAFNQMDNPRRIGEEVVFFKPSIMTSKKGQFSLEFNAPTTLSQWKFKLLALDEKLNGAAEEQMVSTFKPFFLDPYLPQFLRRGDTFFWKTPLANLTDDVIEGKASLLLVDPLSKQNITSALSAKADLNFTVETHSETYLNWVIDLNNANFESVDFVMSASSSIFEDRVKSNIPILTDQVSLSENLPIFMPPFFSDTISFDWKANPKFTYVNQPLDWVWEVLPTFFEEEASNNTIQLVNQRLAAVIAHQMGKTAYFEQIAIIDEWLEEVQNKDGGFSWFPNGRSNPYITFYLLDLSSRMDKQPLPKEVIKNALKYLNESKLPEIYLAYINALWSLKNKNQSLSIDDWSDFPPLQKIMLGRYYLLTNQMIEAQAILSSLKETALGNFNTGIFWAKESWGGALQLASDALLFFVEMKAEKEWIQGLQMEILKHKRLNGWGNSKASALAISSLWATFSEVVNASIQEIQFEWIDNGEKSSIKIFNPNAVPAWGSILQNYTQPIDEVEAYRQGPLKLERSYFYELNEEWLPLNNGEELKVGQTVKVVLNIENESPMQTIVLRDEFPASAELPYEPSSYRWHRNVSYYQTRDRDAMLFYFDDLPRGSHQVSYKFQLGRSGSFHTGISTITSAYDETFGSFDENMRWNIK